MSGLQITIFNAEQGAVSGILVLGESYQPSQTSSVVYFNAGEGQSLQELVNRMRCPQSD